nr:SDR family NAD(P)-dependent oxidoreductase [Chitinimonas arctica]
MKNLLSDLAGKTYIVTGASSGIGAATALALGHAGANVVLAARRQAVCEDLAAQIVAAGARAMVVQTDVSVEADNRRLVEAAVDRFGKLDGAFNNAGLLGSAAPLHQASTADFEAVLRTNVMGVFWSMKYQIEAMLKTGGGAIVNNASIAAQVGFVNIAPYNSSKHAVMGLTRTAALEYFKQGIRINAVCPGPITTPMAELAMGGSDNLHAMMVDSPAGVPVSRMR